MAEPNCQGMGLSSDPYGKFRNSGMPPRSPFSHRCPTANGGVRTAESARPKWPLEPLCRCRHAGLIAGLAKTDISVPKKLVKNPSKRPPKTATQSRARNGSNWVPGIQYRWPSPTGTGGDHRAARFLAFSSPHMAIFARWGAAVTHCTFGTMVRIVL